MCASECEDEDEREDEHVDEDQVRMSCWQLMCHALPEDEDGLFMEQQGLEPNRITYIAVSSACGKCRMPKRALRLFDEMQQQGLEPGAVTSGLHTYVFFFTLPTPHASKKQHPMHPKSTYIQ